MNKNSNSRLRVISKKSNESVYSIFERTGNKTSIPEGITCSFVMNL